LVFWQILKSIHGCEEAGLPEDRHREWGRQTRQLSTGGRKIADKHCSTMPGCISRLTESIIARVFE
jgi:hypothetical protein